MNIKSDYSDYYDSVLPMFFDKRDKFWLRKVSQIEEEIVKVRIPHDYYILFVCGKAYPFYHYKFSDTTNYDMDELIKKSKTDKYISYAWDVKDLKIFCDNYNDDTLHRKFNTPVFMVHNEEGYSASEKRHVKHQCVTLNPRLNQYKFAKVIDPYTICQEIDMYMSNILTEEVPIIQISDIDMKKKKGFAHKYAFKKEPTKKR